MIRLDVGMDGKQQTVSGCGVAALCGLGLFFVLFFLPVMIAGGKLLLALTLPVVLLVLGVVVFGAVMMIRRTRYAAWLEGTVLVVRAGFGTQRCDLARAPRISAETIPVYASYGDNVTMAGRMPQLIAWDDANQQITVNLRSGRQVLLPPHQLLALASAISAGSRPEPYATEARQVAYGLQQLANNPVMRFL